MTETIETAPAAPEPVAAPVTDAGPRSTNDIAAQVIADADATPVDTSPSDDGAPAAPSPDALPEKLSPAAAFLAGLGHKAVKADGRPVWLPFGTVEKMLEKYATQHGAHAWESERTTLAKERDDMRQALQQVREAVAADPQRFLAELSQIDPRYRTFLQPAAPTAPTAPADEEPGPDLDLGDGRRTYSLEGLKAREAWMRRQIEAAVEAKLKPIAEREQRTQLETQTRATYQREIADAQTWAGFGALPADGSLTPFQQEVLGELQKDSEQARARGTRPQMTLRQAYLEVYARQQDPAAIRARVLDELKAIPATPAVSRSGPEPVRTPGRRTTADIARSVIGQLDAG